MINGASHIDTFPDLFEEQILPLELGPEVETDGDMSKSGSDQSTSDLRKEEAYASRPASQGSLQINLEILAKYRQLPKLRPQDKELHLRRIAGLDVVPELLAEAIAETAPPPSAAKRASDASGESSSYTFSFMDDRDRWESLQIELWLGSLDTYNETLDNFEAFLMTEVIEHLNERTLDKFPSVLFGSYRPRIVIITTPNYGFNQYFRKSRSTGDDGKSTKPEAETKNSFPDPTGRTQRVFRDSDHKFEWTQDEFRQWCNGITNKYDYDVQFTGVGSLRNYFGRGGFHHPASEPLPRHPEGLQSLLNSVEGGDAGQFFATQIAVFRRLFAYESERTPRNPVQVPLAFFGTASLTGKGAPGAGSTRSEQGGGSPNQHKLLKVHSYEAAEQAANPKSLTEIR